MQGVQDKSKRNYKEITKIRGSEVLWREVGEEEHVKVNGV